MLPVGSLAPPESVSRCLYVSDIKKDLNFIQKVKERCFCMFSVRKIFSRDTWSNLHIQKHILFQFPAVTWNQWYLSLFTFSVSASPQFYLKMVVYQCILSCVSDFGGRSGCLTWVTDGELWEDGRSECKHSLSLHCHNEGGVCVWGWDHRIRMCLTLLVIV